MNFQQQSRKEYIHRINRVADHVEANLDRELSLQSLAEVAHFSPFHFHRIFRALTGETVNNYVKRIRLQKAGSMLLSDPLRPVEEVSTICGFSSTPVFCRAFRDHYGMNTGAFRKYHSEPERKNGQMDRNTDQEDRKSHQEFQTASIYLSDEDIHFKNTLSMEAKIEVKDMPGMDLVYCRHIGPFDQIGRAYEKLFRWAGPRGLIRGPETKTVTVYHDDPKVVDPDKVKQSACITVDGEVRTEGEFGLMHIPGGRHVVGSFEITPDKFSDAWDNVCRWLADSGYQPTDGYPFELYPKEHTKDPIPVFTVDICIPVKPL